VAARAVTWFDQSASSSGYALGRFDQVPPAGAGAVKPGVEPGGREARLPPNARAAQEASRARAFLKNLLFSLKN